MCVCACVCVMHACVCACVRMCGFLVICMRLYKIPSPLHPQAATAHSLHKDVSRVYFQKVPAPFAAPCTTDCIFPGSRPVL